MNNFLYRFRRTEKLFEFQELERQEIYFASPQELNDPLEGFKDFFWLGDEVIWKNLLKHYMLCLEHVICLFLLGKVEDVILEKDIPVFKTENDFSTPQHKDLFFKICNSFFGNTSISKYPKWLASRAKPIRKNELISHLRHMHSFAVTEILKLYQEHNLMPTQCFDDEQLLKNIREKLIDPDMLSGINSIDLEHSKNINASEALYHILNNTDMQLYLINKHNEKIHLSQNKEMIFVEFPYQYIKALERIAYNDWYAACFLSDYKNPALWAYYGDDHKGVCLKFKTKNELSHISLQGVVGSRGNIDNNKLIYGSRNYKFHKVNYCETFPEIDFFRSLGCLNSSQLNSWYLDEHGNKSRCSEDIFQNENEWREQYWNKHYKSITSKLPGWSKEEEYRLVHNSFMFNYAQPEVRKWKYSFQDLEGIIFGMNTSTKDKLAVMKILESKFSKESNPNFKLYQASYLRGKNEMEISKLGLIKFTTN